MLQLPRQKMCIQFIRGDCGPVRIITTRIGGAFGRKDLPFLPTGVFNAMATATRHSGGAKLPDLPGAKQGNVVCRFSPEPSGYLHIGHAKAALLNAYFVKKYEGKLIVRFDDTNPAKEKMEFESSILEDLRLLEIETRHHTHTSDYFPQIQEHCTALLKKGVFYCDETDALTMRAERAKGIESACRSRSIEENLRVWGEMLAGSPEGVKNCVRAKIDMLCKNKCMRDPVMFRCVTDIPHHRHGTMYKAYPTYDFACPIVDSLEGVTHAMRANEYADRVPQYFWVLKACNLEPIEIYEFSRMNFVNTVLSKRKLQWLVDTGVVEAWDDPRFPTVRGVRRRGLTVAALMDFITEQGASKNVNLMEWDKLWAKNKQVIDPIVPRYFAVSKDDGVLVTIEDGPETVENRERPRHAKNPTLGNTTTRFSRQIIMEKEDAAKLGEGDEFTLMRWCNAIVIKPLEEGNGMTVKLNPEGSFKTTKVKAHWVSADNPFPVTIREYDHIITKRKPEEDDNFEDIVNRNSVADTVALAEPSFAQDLKKGEKLQFERRGYFVVDDINSDRAICIKIPDGKTKAMSVISTKIDSAKLSKGTS